MAVIQLVENNSSSLLEQIKKQILLEESNNQDLISISTARRIKSQSSESLVGDCLKTCQYYQNAFSLNLFHKRFSFSFQSLNVSLFLFKVLNSRVKIQNGRYGSRMVLCWLWEKAFFKLPLYNWR